MVFVVARRLFLSCVRSFTSSSIFNRAQFIYSTRNSKILEDLSGHYPSLSRLPRATLSVREFVQKYRELLKNDNSAVNHILNGQVVSIRTVGKSMCFIDICEQGTKLQLILNSSILRKNDSSLNTEVFQALVNTFRPGDHIQAKGYPGLSQQKQTLSLKCVCSPIMLSAAQVPVPPVLKDIVKRRENRVLDYLVNGHDILINRYKLIQSLRKFLDSRGFIEVETPILSAKSSGANARPFTTHLNSLSKQSLELRIAPELWLKRLSIAGVHRVFEIGKVFRNEGVDSVHNPEFTTLEFYQCYTSMGELIELSEQLVKSVCEAVQTPVAKELLAEFQANGCKFRQVNILPVLFQETGIDWSRVNLTNSDEMLAALTAQGIHMPANIRSPQQILNKLCVDYIEPKYCQSLLPIALCHYPTVTSPLAKGDEHITNRFEVFIRGREYINAYEEENCPQIQSAKFHSQQIYKDKYQDNDSMAVDSGYIAAMGYGMPPIGGLGLGIDRLCMLLFDKNRIEDVMPFGCIDDVCRQ